MTPCRLTPRNVHALAFGSTGGHSNHFVELRMLECLKRLQYKWSVYIFWRLSQHTWSVAMSHSIAACLNNASEYGITRSLTFRSSRCGSMLDCCLAASAAFFASFRIFVAFGSFETKSFFAHQVLYATYTNVRMFMSQNKIEVSLLSEWLQCAVGASLHRIRSV